MLTAVTNVLLDALMAAIGSDTVTFAGSVVGLITSDFTPTPATRLDGLDVDAHGGMEVKVMNGTSVDTGIDAVTGERQGIARPPAGGWLFEISADPAEPYQVFGWCWAPSALSTAFKSAKFDTPIDINTAHQQVVIDKVAFQILLNGVQ